MPDQKQTPSKPSSARSGSVSSEKHSARQSSFSQSTPAAGASRHIACRPCRERKVRCQGGQPACAGCQKRGQECVYPVSRNSDAVTEEISQTIKTLASRLARAEAEIAGQKSLGFTSPTSTPNSIASFNGLSLADNHLNLTCSPFVAGVSATDFQQLHALAGATTNFESNEHIPQDVRDILYARYFDSTHVPFPMVHQGRYMSKVTADGSWKEETIALMNAILAHAAMGSAEYAEVEDSCYRNCRRHLEKTELGDQGGEMLTLEAAQACLLIALYEFKRKYFTRAWLSTGRALRIVQMLRLHKLDGSMPAFPHEAPMQQIMSNQPHHGWLDETEQEERVRTFWVAYSLDRFSNTGTDWPVTLDDNEISTPLPSPGSLESIDTSTQQTATPSLHYILTASSAPGLSSFMGAAIMAHLWGRCASHLYTTSRNPLTSSAENVRAFWARHYDIDGTVTRIVNSCCSHLVSSNGHINQIGPMSGYNSPNNGLTNTSGGGGGNMTMDSNAIFLNLVSQTVIIYLHEAAARQAELTGLPPGVQNESEIKCKVAAMEIAALAQRVSTPMIFAEMNFFTARCLHAAARVLIQTIKRLHGDARFFELLHCLLNVMNACKAANPLIEYYLQQLSQEFEGDSAEVGFLPT